MSTGESQGTATRARRWPDVTRLIPHRPPILMVEEIVGGGEGELICRGALRCNAPSVQGAMMSPILALELAAQTAAVLAALETGEAPANEAGVGYLAAIHDARFLQPEIPMDRQLLATVRRLQKMRPLYKYAVHVALEVESIELVQAVLSIYKA